MSVLPNAVIHWLKTDWQIAHALLLNCDYAYSQLKNLPTLLRAAGKKHPVCSTETGWNWLLLKTSRKAIAAGSPNSAVQMA